MTWLRCALVACRPTTHSLDLETLAQVLVPFGGVDLAAAQERFRLSQVGLHRVGEVGHLEGRCPVSRSGRDQGRVRELLADTPMAPLASASNRKKKGAKEKCCVASQATSAPRFRRPLASQFHVGRDCAFHSSIFRSFTPSRGPGEGYIRCWMAFRVTRAGTQVRAQDTGAARAQRRVADVRQHACIHARVTLA